MPYTYGYDPSQYESDWGRQNLQQQTPYQQIPQGRTTGGNALSALGNVKDVYSMGRDIPGLGGKIGGLGSKFAGKVGSLTGGKINLGNIGKATPWGLGGTALALAGKFVGKHNYRTGGAMSGMGKGAATGATIGSIIPGIGTVVGGLVGGAIGGIKGWLGGAKRKRQQHQLDLQKQQAENDQMFSNLQATYGGGRMNQGAGAASSEAQAMLNQQSPEDQAAILKSFGNRDALQEWYQNAKADQDRTRAAQMQPPPEAQPSRAMREPPMDRYGRTA